MPEVLDAIKAVAAFLAGQLMLLFMFGLGLGLEPRALRRGMRREIFWRGLALALLAAPLLTIVIVSLLAFPPLVASILLLSAVAPGAPFLVRTVKVQGGDVELGAALSLVLTLLAVLLLPLSLQIIGDVSGVTYQADYRAIARRVLVPMVGALGLGLLIRRYRPRAAAWLFRWSVRLFKIALVLVVAALIAPATRGLRSLGWLALGAGLAIPLLVAAVGHVAGGPDPRERRTIAISAVFGNPVVALAVTAATLRDPRALPVMAACLVLRLLALQIYRLAAGRRRPLTGGHLAADVGRRT